MVLQTRIFCLVREKWLTRKKNPSLQNHFSGTTFLEKWLQIKWLSVYSTWDIYVWHCNEQRQWRHFSKSSLISQPSSTVPPALEALCIVTYEGAAAYSAPAR